MDTAAPTTPGTREYVMIGLALVSVLQILDLASTYLALRIGAHEANPLLGGLIHTPVPALLKALCAVWMWFFGLKCVARGERSAERAMFIVWVGVAFYLVAVVSNCLTITRYW